MRFNERLLTLSPPCSPCHTHTRAVKNFRCEHKLFCRSGHTWPDDDQYYKLGARRCFTILLTSHSCFRGSKSGSRLLQEEALLQPWRGSRMRQKSWGPVKWVADDIIFHGGGVWRWWWWRKGSEIVMEGMSAGGQGKLFTAFCRLCEFVCVNMATDCGTLIFRISELGAAPPDSCHQHKNAIEPHRKMLMEREFAMR